jgi:hypothetical protein
MPAPDRGLAVAAFLRRAPVACLVFFFALASAIAPTFGSGTLG